MIKGLMHIPYEGSLPYDVCFSVSIDDTRAMLQRLQRERAAFIKDIEPEFRATVAARDALDVFNTERFVASQADPTIEPWTGPAHENLETLWMACTDALRAKAVQIRQGMLDRRFPDPDVYGEVTFEDYAANRKESAAGYPCHWFEYFVIDAFEDPVRNTDREETRVEIEGIDTNDG